MLSINFGGFCRGFSWRIFLFFTFPPRKMRRKNLASTKSAKKCGGPKIKIREKSVLPKIDPKKSLSLDGAAIRSSECGAISHESFRRKKIYFHNVWAIRANRLKLAEIRKQFSAPKRSQKRGSVWEPSLANSQESGVRANHATRFLTRIGPSKSLKSRSKLRLKLLLGANL